MTMGVVGNICALLFSSFIHKIISRPPVPRPAQTPKAMAARALCARAERTPRKNAQTHAQKICPHFVATNSINLFLSNFRNLRPKFSLQISFLLRVSIPPVMKNGNVGRSARPSRSGPFRRLFKKKDGNEVGSNQPFSFRPRLCGGAERLAVPSSRWGSRPELPRRRLRKWPAES